MHFTRVSEKAGDEDDAQTEIVWRAIRAKVLARRGDVAAGEALAREAVERAHATDYLEDIALTLLDLAEVLELAGRTDEAVRAIEKAIALFERKQAVPAAERARARLR